MANRLAQETSPYLLQHAHNPVDWYPFGEEAFARAKALDRPILLSVGYAACHWCHVMERESFEDAGVAEVMNERFVSIKVDREERPEVDQVYQQACQLITRQGGWPLTVFLLPDGRPFFAGTYFPPTEKYGRPSFRRVLITLSDAYQHKRGDVDESAQQLLAGMGRLNDVEGRGTASLEVAEEAAGKLVLDIDPRHGGFGRAPKFPHATGLSFLLARALRGGDAKARGAVLLTLRRMAEGGIYDQLGGGFHRYSVDDHWAVPHFEKMLYDQGQLLALYLAAWRASGEALFRRVYDESVEYLLREMRSPEGGFYATQDADSEGEEGKFFVWTLSDLTAVLGAERARIAAMAFGVTAAGNFEHGATVLHIAHDAASIAQELGIAADEVERALPGIRKDLLAARETRVKPARDDKQIASWIGLVIAALARSPEPAHVEAAVLAARFVETTLWDGTRLLRTFKDGVAKHEGVLDDYAYYAWSLTLLFDATQDAHWLDLAVAIADHMIPRFYEDEEGAFFVIARDAGLIQRPRSSFDQATPAGVGIAAMLLSRLEALTGRTELGAVAEATFRTYAELMAQNPFAFGSLCEAMDAHLSGLTTVVIVGPAGAAATNALVTAARARFHPDVLVVRIEDGLAPAALESLARGKTLHKGKPCAYVCRRQTCSAPVTEPDDLGPLL